MREIKFRGKDIDQNKWRYGGYVKSIIELHYICETDGQFWIVPLETIGQSTGLFDKNSVEIFEGDIIRPFVSFDVLYVVEYFKCGLIGKRIDAPNTTIELPSFAGVCEVIGNIYDAKEGEE